MKLHKLMLTVIAGSLFFASCSDDDSNSAPRGAYDNGLIVLNQGIFNSGNASVSFISDAGELENNVYGANNSGAVLGDVGQDVGLNGRYAYIVLNVSNKIEVVDRYTFTHVATITTGLVNPRYIAFHGGKGYVTNWGAGGVTTDDYVAVINLATNAVTTTIPVTEGPERIIEEDGKLYVSHMGGYGYGNSITVINGATNTISTTITVGDVPNTLEIEDDKLYVLNEGKNSYSGSENAGSLSVINLRTNTVERTLAFSGIQHPSNLTIEDDVIYYTLGGNVYTLGLNSTTLPAAPLFSATAQGVASVSAFAVEDRHIYVADSGDYSAAGKVHIYSLTGTFEKTHTVGLIPAGFYFND